MDDQDISDVGYEPDTMARFLQTHGCGQFVPPVFSKEGENHSQTRDDLSGALSKEEWRKLKELRN